MAASFLQGAFKAPANYAADDLESYSSGVITIFNMALGVGSCDLPSGWLYSTPKMGVGNYGSDDFEKESAGPISGFYNAYRSGDTLLKKGRLH